MDTVTNLPAPRKEPVRGYAPGSTERTTLEAELKALSVAKPIDIPCTIGGTQRLGGGDQSDVVQPHNHGAVVGQQPFGGARGSGTNDKAGSIFNLQRWASPRAIKENFVPPTTVDYPHQN